MTWLPVQAEEVPERDAVLGLAPEPYAVVREALVAAWQITDPRALELCRLRLAQLVDARAELAGAGEELLAELDRWEASAVFTERERAFLAFAEQYHYDHQRLTSQQWDELARHLSLRDTVNFVWALHMNFAYARVLSLLDVAPDPPGASLRPERAAPATIGDLQAREPPASTGGAGPPRASSRFQRSEQTVTGVSRERVNSVPTADGDVRSLMDLRFEVVYRRLNPVVVRQSLVDDVTSEAVRLHNASYQGCVY